MNENRIEASVRDVAGHVPDATADLTGTATKQLRGKARQTAGSVQNAYREAAGRARGAVTVVNAVLIAGAIGYLMSWLLNRRWTTFNTNTPPDRAQRPSQNSHSPSL